MANKKKRVCAVCGDTCQTNVRLKWQRTKDNLIFDICCLCAESNKVNSRSVNNYGPSVEGNVIR